MNGNTRRHRRLAPVLVVCVTTAFFSVVSAASAVQSDQYDVFGPTSCPTSSPYFNNPEFPEVSCAASVTDKTSIEFGEFAGEVTSPTTLRFALAPGAVEPEVCGYACFRSVPGSTELDMAPQWIRLHHGYGRVHGHRGIEVTVEPAGDLHAFSLTEGVPVFKLPLKVHLQSRLLGSSCYIGSNASPIEVALVPTAEPTLEGLPDPNGFPVFVIFLHGFDTEALPFAVPAASGCGPVVGPPEHRVHLLDGLVNAALGLPAPSGNSMVLSGTDITLALSSAGGGVLQAAFDAAK